MEKLKYSNSNNSKITCIEDSPVIDVIALGFSSGEIVCLNLKSFKRLKTFSCTDSIISLSFSDCSITPLLCSSNASRKTNLWCLNTSRLIYSLQLTGLTQVMFVPNEPLLLVTSGEANYIKLFYFTEGLEFSVPRLIKERTGFIETPSLITFYGEDEKHLIAMSKRQLRVLSSIREEISSEIRLKKLGYNNAEVNFSTFDVNYYRERDWSNLMVINNSNVKDKNSFSPISLNKVPLFFNTQTKSLTSNNSNSSITKSFSDGISFNKQDFLVSNEVLTAVGISFCGKYGFAGFSSGLLAKFAMQSGVIRTVKVNQNGKSIKNIKTDGLNSLVIVIFDGIVLWIDFVSLETVYQLNLSVSKAEIDKNTDLLCFEVGTTLQIYNKSNFKRIRKFDVSCKINDFCFAGLGRWIAVVTSDCLCVIYDIKSDLIIEKVKLIKEAVAICSSVCATLLALSYKDENYVQLMLNREMYVDSVTEGSNNIVESFGEAIFATQVKRIAKRRLNEAETVPIKELKEVIGNLKFNSNSQIDNIDIRLSEQNKTKYRQLVHFDLLVTTPKVLLKEKTAAPFFLFDINKPDLDITNRDQAKKQHKETPISKLERSSNFNQEKILKEAKEEKDKKRLRLTTLLEKKESVIGYLKTLSPEQIDIELRSLAPVFNSNSNHLIYFFCSVIENEIQKNNNFEMVHACLNRFLKLYCDFFTDEKLNDELKNKLKIIKEAINQKKNRLAKLFRKSLCLISTLS